MLKEIYFKSTIEEHIASHSTTHIQLELSNQNTLVGLPVSINKDGTGFTLETLTGTYVIAWSNIIRMRHMEECHVL